MDKYKIFIIFSISLCLIIDGAGVVLNDLILIVLGPIIAILLLISPYLISADKKQKMFIPEKDKYETVLSFKSKKERFKNKRSFLSIFMGLVLTVIVFYIIWFFIGNYLYTPSSLSIENVINAGCKELNEGTGRCLKDPNTIIVKYDVNGDDATGGVNDTLAALLAKQNCTGVCVKQRCNCIYA